MKYVSCVIGAEINYVINYVLRDGSHINLYVEELELEQMSSFIGFSKSKKVYYFIFYLLSEKVQI